MFLGWPPGGHTPTHVPHVRHLCATLSSHHFGARWVPAVRAEYTHHSVHMVNMMSSVLVESRARGFRPFQCRRKHLVNGACQHIGRDVQRWRDGVHASRQHPTSPCLSLCAKKKRPGGFCRELKGSESEKWARIWLGSGECAARDCRGRGCFFIIRMQRVDVRVTFVQSTTPALPFMCLPKSRMLRCTATL